MGMKAKLYIGHNKGQRGLKIVSKVVAKHFEGATLANAKGFYKGEFEPVVTVELLSTAPHGDNFKPRVKALAAELRTALVQQCVLVEFTEVGIEFV